jgi:hypothetical protein
LNKRYIIWLSVSQRLSRGLYNGWGGCEFEDERSELVRQHFLEVYSQFYSQFGGAYQTAVWAYSEPRVWRVC